MKTNNSLLDFSFCKWYPLFHKNALEAAIIPLPEEIINYLEHGTFLLPVEAINNSNSCKSEWLDGSAVTDESDEDSEDQPSFPEFSAQIQDVINNFGSVFVKLNWSSPSDAVWVAPTKTLKCESLEDIYLLLKSSDRISQDLSSVKGYNNGETFIKPCLVLKRWYDIDPCTEFRCFVINNELVGIGQRDVSQYYMHIENDKYDIQQDIKSLFVEKIKNILSSDNYVFDVIRYKKDKVKIVDFAPLNEAVTKGTLFTFEELHNNIADIPEFRFIAEDMGIQPKPSSFCIPQEINEFFHKSKDMSTIDAIQKEVEEQKRLESDTCE